MKIGPRTEDQFRRLRSVWRQGEHIVISGSTGSGKTTLGRMIDEIRVERGGHVVIFVCKPVTDKTIVQDYKGWIRWKEWKKNPAPHENKILLWPDTSKAKNAREIKAIQAEVFGRAMDAILRSGKWAVDWDEGLYMCDPQFLNMKDDIAMFHAIGRSEGITCITKMQRPSNVPLIVYGSASHAFIGRTREAVDTKRLSEMGAKTDAKELARRISEQGRHDFLWVPVSVDWEPETVNLRS